jgi:hypothetical protein
VRSGAEWFRRKLTFARAAAETDPSVEAVPSLSRPPGDLSHGSEGSKERGAMENDKKTAAAAEASIRRSISKLEAQGVNVAGFLYFAARAEARIGNAFQGARTFENLTAAICDYSAALYAPSVIAAVVKVRGTADMDVKNGEAAERQLREIGKALVGVPVTGQRYGAPMRVELRNLEKVQRRDLLTWLLESTQPVTDSTLRKAKQYEIISETANALELTREIDINRAAAAEKKRRGLRGDAANPSRVAASQWAAKIEGITTKEGARREDDRLRKWKAKWDRSAPRSSPWAFPWQSSPWPTRQNAGK